MALIEFEGGDRYDPETFILRNGSICFFSSMENLQLDLQWFEDKGYKVYVLNCDRWRSLSDFHDDVSKALDFEDYYGRNMDAFNDSVHDLRLEGYKGGVIVFLSFEMFWKRFPEEALMVLDSVSLASRRYLITGVKLIGFVKTDDANFRAPDFGGSGGTWSLREMFPKTDG